MSRPRPARKSERGLTLLETVVALAIIFIVFLGLTDAGLLVVEYNLRNTIRDEGVSVADNVMADVRQTPFVTLDAEPNGIAVDLPDEYRKVRGYSMRFTRKRTIENMNDDTLRVVVDVGWNRRGKAYTHQETTIVRKR